MTERAKKKEQIEETTKRKEEQIEEIAKRLVGLDEDAKSYIVGYMNGIQEERQRWKKKLNAAIA